MKDARIIHRDLDKLEKWAHRNLMRFDETKCKVLHMDQGNPQYQSRLRDEQIKSSLAQKDLRMPVDERLDMPCPCSLYPFEESDLAKCIPSSINIFRQLPGSSQC